MTDFMKDLEAHYPTQKDIDAALMDARILRAKAMRDGAISLWAMLRRAATIKPMIKPVHARTSEV